jgi:hypothetical protein
MIFEEFTERFSQIQIVKDKKKLTITCKPLSIHS